MEAAPRWKIFVDPAESDHGPDEKTEKAVERDEGA